MPEFTGRWTGQLRAGSEAEHDQFVDSLRTPAAASLLTRCGLTHYALYRNGLELEIHFASERPSIIAGFLRNRRMWPEYWEFKAPGQEGVAAEKPLAFEWIRP